MASNTDYIPSNTQRSKSNFLNDTFNLVHPDWEVIDPIPDIFALFDAFDERFFQKKLKCVSLEWSKRMYSCAGICYTRKNGLGSSCTIRLSEPLLKLRPRRDLVQTLLHEMIHAFLFISHIREGNGGHGPNFIRIMTSINKIAGTSISVYHTFNDEVHFYRTHIWRCNGICQHRKPFFGYVRRTCNRAPGPNDFWWQQHKEICGGYFEKLAEPNDKNVKLKEKSSSTKATTKPVVQSTKGITTYFPKLNKQSALTITSGGGGDNIKGFGDLTKPPKPITAPFAGGIGKKLGTSENSTIPLNAVRDVWNRKYAPSLTTTATENVDNDNKNLENSSNWKKIDDEIEIKEITYETINLCNDDTNNNNNKLNIQLKSNNQILTKYNEDSSWQIIDLVDADDDDVDDDDDGQQQINTKVKQISIEERQKLIKNEILEDNFDKLKNDDVNNDVNNDNIEIIDDEYDDTLANINNYDLLDTSIVDDLFGLDTLMNDFNNLNGVIMKDCENIGKQNKEIIACPICNEKMSRESLDDHLDGCSGIRKEIKIKYAGNEKLQANVPEVRSIRQNYRKRIKNNDLNARDDARINPHKYMRRVSGPGPSQKSTTRSISHSANESGLGTNNTSAIEQCKCPVCNKLITTVKINAHLDSCLNKIPI